MMVRASLAPSTLRGYEGKGLAVWRFHLKHSAGWSEAAVCSNLIFLSESADSEEYVYLMLSEFIYRMKVPLQYTQSMVNQTLKALGHECMSAGHPRIARALNSDLISKVRKYGTRIAPRATQLVRDERRTKSMTPLMMQFLLNRTWHEAYHSFSIAEMDLAIGALAIALQMTCCLRASNVVRTETVQAQDAYALRHAEEVRVVGGMLEAVGGIRYDRHVLRCGTCVFFDVEIHGAMMGVTQQERREGFRRMSAYDFALWVRQDKQRTIGIYIKCVIIRVRTSKSNQDGRRYVEYKIASRVHKNHEEMGIKMGEAAIRAEYDTPNDAFFSRPPAADCLCMLFGQDRDPEDHDLVTTGARDNLAEENGHIRHTFSRGLLNGLVGASATATVGSSKGMSSNSARMLGVTLSEGLRQRMGNEVTFAHYHDHQSVATHQMYVRELPGGHTPLSLIECENVFGHISKPYSEERFSRRFPPGEPHTGGSRLRFPDPNRIIDLEADDEVSEASDWSEEEQIEDISDTDGDEELEEGGTTAGKRRRVEERVFRV